MKRIARPVLLIAVATVSIEDTKPAHAQADIFKYYRMVEQFLPPEARIPLWTPPQTVTRRRPSERRVETGDPIEDLERNTARLKREVAQYGNVNQLGAWMNWVCAGRPECVLTPRLPTPVYVPPQPTPHGSLPVGSDWSLTNTVSGRRQLELSAIQHNYLFGLSKTPPPPPPPDYGDLVSSSTTTARPTYDGLGTSTSAPSKPDYDIVGSTPTERPSYNIESADRPLKKPGYSDIESSGGPILSRLPDGTTVPIPAGVSATDRVSLLSWISGGNEDDRVTSALITEAIASCEGDARSDCALFYARNSKIEVTSPVLNQDLYLSRRNAEHYFYAKHACESPRQLLGVNTPYSVRLTAVAAVIPVYTVLKDLNVLWGRVFPDAASRHVSASSLLHRLDDRWGVERGTVQGYITGRAFVNSPGTLKESLWAWKGLVDCR